MRNGDGVNTMFEEKFFLRKKKNENKLLDYGFTREAEAYQYVTSVMDGQFSLYVRINGDGGVSTRMIERDSGEEYSLYKVPSSVGAFVGEVRSVCEAVLTDIAQRCYEPDVYQSEQARAIIEYVRDKYGDELEFLWEKLSTTAIWRRQDTQKWYGLVFTIDKKKLGFDDHEIVEAIDLRLSPEQMAQTVDGKRYFPGWHMNKKTWYTMLLDGSVPTKELYQRIDESYRLATK